MAAEVTDANFADEVLKSQIPVLVDFWAPWCPPCRQLTPIIEQLAKEQEGKVKIVKINIDESQKTAFEYGVDSIPLVIVFKGGQEVDRFLGLRPKNFYEGVISKAFA